MQIPFLSAGVAEGTACFLHIMEGYPPEEGECRPKDYCENNGGYILRRGVGGCWQAPSSGSKGSGGAPGSGGTPGSGDAQRAVSWGCCMGNLEIQHNSSYDPNYYY